MGHKYFTSRDHSGGPAGQFGAREPHRMGEGLEPVPDHTRGIRTAAFLVLVAETPQPGDLTGGGSSSPYTVQYRDWHTIRYQCRYPGIDIYIWTMVHRSLDFEEGDTHPVDPTGSRDGNAILGGYPQFLARTDQLVLLRRACADHQPTGRVGIILSYCNRLSASELADH